MVNTGIKNMSESREFRQEKNDAKVASDDHFAIFSQKVRILTKKKDKSFSVTKIGISVITIVPLKFTSKYVGKF